MNPLIPSNAQRVLTRDLQHCLLQDPNMDDTTRFDFCDLDTCAAYILTRPPLRTAGWLFVRTRLSQVPGTA